MPTCCRCAAQRSEPPRHATARARLLTLRCATLQPSVRFKRYGPVFRVQLSGTRLTVVNDMAALKGVLRDDGALLE